MTVGARREFRMAWIFGPDCGSSRNRRPTRVWVNDSTCSRTWTAAASQLNFPWTKTESYWTIRRCSGESPTEPVSATQTVRRLRSSHAPFGYARGGRQRNDSVCSFRETRITNG